MATNNILHRENPDPAAFLLILILVLLMAYTKTVNGQHANFQGAIGSEDWTRNWSEYKPGSKTYLPSNHILRGTIKENTILTRKNCYLIQGMVYVAPGISLTIEDGTILRGDHTTCGTLVIARGAKIIAKGTELNPIVFTSNKPANDRKAGDWGGIVILGNAPVNKAGGVSTVDFGLDAEFASYGGANVNDNSGVLSFVRIEFPGNKISADKEFNGLTLAGVGRGTQIENIQISYSNDDSFEMYGGTATLKNIISFKCTDDDFDFNYGYEGKMMQALAIRHPLIMDFSGSHCIEADSYSGDRTTMNANGKKTNITVSNLSLIVLEDPTFKGKAKEAIHVGKEVSILLSSSVLSGFENAVSFRDEKAFDMALKNEIRINNTLFNNCSNEVFHSSKTEDLKIYFSNADFRNNVIKYPLENLFVNSGDKSFPDFRLKFSEIAELK